MIEEAEGASLSDLIRGESKSLKLNPLCACENCFHVHVHEKSNAGL